MNRPDFSNEEINLLDYWDVLKKRKKILIAIPFIAAVLAAMISLVLPITYRAKAVIIPMGGSQGGMAAALGQSQSGLGAILGGLVDGLGTNSTQLLAILKSRTLSEKVISELDLNRVLYEKVWDGKHERWTTTDPLKLPNPEDSAERLFKKVKFAEDKKLGTIKMTGEFKDPILATNVINTYLKELNKHINENTFTIAKRNRIFIEEQLERNKGELLESGKQLSAFYATNKISNVVPTLDVDVSARQEEDEGDVADNDEPLVPVPQPTFLRTDSPGIPWVPTAIAEIQNKTQMLQKQVEDLGEKIHHARIVRNVPQQVYLQYLSLKQELLGRVNALLTQQYELAKVEENKEDLTFQVIDYAQVPVRKYKPKRTLIVLATFILSLFLTVFYIFFREYLEKMKWNSQSDSRSIQQAPDSSV